MNSTAYWFLTLALLINNSISSQIGPDKKVKMNVMLNTTEDGLAKASLYITNATSTMLNNASHIASMEALLAENNTVIVSLLEKGYEYIEGLGFYKYHSNKADFQNAVRICENEETHLGVIDSEKEADEFIKLMRKNGDYSAWVGIHDPHRSRSFQSIFGTPFNALGYKKWMTGEPDNYHGDEYCLYYYIGGYSRGFGDYSCKWSRRFICEIEI